ncbi:hypothetical protein, partial [Yersinia wautersii]|uniref:hypothetical protein n=2 Tax=Yersinia wautersii TaxID=1341643 RepID=UPI001EE15975
MAVPYPTPEHNDELASSRDGTLWRAKTARLVGVVGRAGCRYCPVGHRAVLHLASTIWMSIMRYEISVNGYKVITTQYAPIGTMVDYRPV